MAISTSNIKITSIYPDQPLSLESISIENNPDPPLVSILEANQRIPISNEINNQNQFQNLNFQPINENFEAIVQNNEINQENINLESVYEQSTKSGVTSTFWIFWLLHVFFIILFVCFLWDLNFLVLVAYFWGVDFCFIKTNICNLMKNRGYN